MTSTPVLPQVKTNKAVLGEVRVYRCPHCQAWSQPEIIDGPWPFQITSRHDLDELIKELRAAARKSKNTGGGYGVYRRATKDPTRYAVAIELILRSYRRRKDDPK